MRFSKICLKQSFSYSKWILPVLDMIPLFYLIVPNFVAFFSICWIRMLMSITKMCLKQ